MHLCATYICSQDFPLNHFKFQYTTNTQQQKMRILHCKRHEKFTDDNVKMCKEIRDKFQRIKDVRFSQ